MTLKLAQGDLNPVLQQPLTDRANAHLIHDHFVMMKMMNDEVLLWYGWPTKGV